MLESSPHEVPRAPRKLHYLRLCDDLPDLDAPLEGDTFVMISNPFTKVGIDEKPVDGHDIETEVEPFYNQPMTLRTALLWLEWIIRGLGDRRFVEVIKVERAGAATCIKIHLGS